MPAVLHEPMPTHTPLAHPADGLTALLAECHDRIRSFTALAVSLAQASAPDPREVTATAQRLRRYFEEGFAQHALDEELSILPRLAGRDGDVDAALVAMHREHEHQRLAVERLVALCAALAADPARHPELAQPLGTAASALQGHLAGHLEREETVIFPALGQVPAALRSDIAAEIRGRRSPGAAVRTAAHGADQLGRAR